jgi:hypothetical protein
MIGVVAEVGEQDIKLFVQPKRGAAIRPAELSGWLAERLAPFQNPRYIAVVDSFERTPSQRIAKRGLPRDDGMLGPTGLTRHAALLLFEEQQAWREAIVFLPG